MPTVPDPALPAYLLWCGACGRSEAKTATEVLGYTRIGWPKCCGQVMAYFAAERPSAIDTALDKPALPNSGDTTLDKPALPPE